ncbi:hypothetical protein OAK75_01750 [Bacteriovoracales bacterium]|nr:hypothetical protein [Bacteriovoracales bacterium]
MKVLTISFILTLSAIAFAKDTNYFVVENSIVINKPIGKVFEFAANPLNDEQWRSEVNKIKASGPWEVGTTYKEDSTLGLNPHYKTITKMLELEHPKKMVVQTGQEHLHLRSERTFKKLDESKTLMTYHVQVDKGMPYTATKLPAPSFLVKIYYSQVMKSYLQKLKRILEQN